MADLNLGVIGNCSFSALIDSAARIVWCCLPAFDGDPVFNRLLNGEEPNTGFCEISLHGHLKTRQAYMRNTAILVTHLEAADGTEIEITDFAPRFRQFGRVYRPNMIIRHIKRRAGAPRITIRVRPTADYGAVTPVLTRGSNHIRYVGPNQVLRLTTNASTSYIVHEIPFILDRDIIMVMGPDESITQSLDELGRAFLERTTDYWLDWSRSLSIPFEWQDAVIRAAITLKLCSYEDTGAVIAAMTTSIPEAPHTARNWDYRFCWLRDGYFTIHALNRLSATRTMEGYLSYISNVVAQAGSDLRPFYGITLTPPGAEINAPALKGYRGFGPVRVGNEAFIQEQNDVYGSVILASTQSFFDSRVTQPSDAYFFGELEPLGERAIEKFDRPDAGIWEFRTRAAVHTFSALMCWAAADRLAKIATLLNLEPRALYWREAADKMHATLCEQAFNTELNSFVASFGGADIDASLLLIHALGFLPPDDPRFIGTVEAVERTLRRGQHLMRYAAEDDFGAPETAFTVCAFWFIEAIAAIGRTEEARQMFEHLLQCRTPLGLLSEDIHPATGELWGNFPQTYSMVGLINCAMRLSKSWEEAL